MNIPVIAASAGLGNNYLQMKTAMIFLAVVLGFLIVGCFAFTLIGKQIKGRKARKTLRTILRMLYLTTCLVFIFTLACFMRFRSVGQKLMDASGATSSSTTEATVPNTTENTTQETTEATEPTVPEPTFTPGMAESSDPENFGMKWEIFQDGVVVDSYQAQESISFGKPEEYFALPGISTFRGNNYRNSASYGTATVELRSMSMQWSSNNVGSLNGWPGVGWTGQPLIVQWDAETKAIMNLYPEKKAKEDLVEVIYATLDGHIYFYDLDDGTYTRNPINVGMNFKGAGSLDPRGYPIMYVGSGDEIGNKLPRMYIISLIDGSILYERSGKDDISTREWCAFDSAPLIDKETDTLIWPGESGVLYTIKLNTVYDKAAGTLTMAPEEVVKTRYATKWSNNDTYWVGYEPSAVIVDRYLYISENGGMFFCIDLDTMRLVWAQDTKDDSNSTPVFEWNGLDGGYIYTAPSLHWTAYNGVGYISIYKLDAKTGEIVWEKRFDCYTVTNVSGGVQSSPILGKPGTQLEGLIIYNVARTTNKWRGTLVALDTETGEIVWEKSMDNYSWSSPVAVYTETCEAYIVVGDSVGNLYMIDHLGNTVSSLNLESNIEASPALFNNTLVIGTRGGLVCGIKIR